MKSTSCRKTNTNRNLAMYGLILLFFSNSVFSEVRYAWWVNLHIDPVSEPSIELRNAAPDFLRVSYLSCDAPTIPVLTESQCDDIRKYGGILAAKADINHDQKKEFMRVGVYQTNEGKAGAFLEISDDGKVYVLRNPGPESFSAIMNVNGSAAWVFCFDCGNFAHIEWKNSSYSLSWPTWE